MSAKDRIHLAVRNALIKDGWTITHDPYTLDTVEPDLYIDLAAERFFAAQKEDQFIAVEVKSFVGASEVSDLQNALGQFIMYHDLLAIKEPYRELLVAVPEHAFIGIFSEPLGQILLNNKRLRLIVIDVLAEEVIRWIR